MILIEAMRFNDWRVLSPVQPKINLTLNQQIKALLVSHPYLTNVLCNSLIGIQEQVSVTFGPLEYFFHRHFFVAFYITFLSF